MSRSPPSMVDRPDYSCHTWYFWKSAKWIKGLRFTASNEAGFRELRDYHLYGDPWREQRYTNDP